MNRLSLAQSSDDLGHLAHHMSSLMHRVLRSGFPVGSREADWVPSVDVCETRDGYEIVVELAGVRRENIEVFTEGRYLTISGWRGDPLSRHKVCVRQMEIERGQFCRRLHLPDDADERGVAARYRDGFLHVSIPKAAGNEAAGGET